MRAGVGGGTIRRPGLRFAPCGLRKKDARLGPPARTGGYRSFQGTVSSRPSHGSPSIPPYVPASPASAGSGFRLRACSGSAAGETREQILSAYPYLESEDIDEALRYAAFLAEDETVEHAPTS